MTYKEIVDSVAQAVKDHKILRDFGYGAITDIKTVNTDQESTTVDYPYVFLNPTQGSRNGQAITYRWNLIAMDVVQEDPDNTYLNYLKVQSDCQQYVDDILAYLRFNTPLNQFDLTLNVQLTPFKERFQDSVAGMTATLEVEVPQKLDNCLTPFDNWVLVSDFTLPSDGVTGYNEFILGSGYAGTQGTYRLEIDVKAENLEALPSGAYIQLAYNPLGVTNYTTIKTQTIPAFDGVTWNQKLISEIVVPAGQTWSFTSFYGDKSQPEQVGAIKTLKGTNYKVYQLQ